MKRFRKILVGLTADEPSTALFDWTRAVATASGAESVDFIICTPDSDAGDPADVSEVTHTIASATDGLNVLVEHERTVPLAGLLARLAGGTYDLLILPIEDGASRSLAERLARKSPVGVLVIPATAIVPPETVVVGIDFSDLSPLCIEWAVAFASLHPQRSQLEAVHFADSTAPARATVAMHGSVFENEVRQSADHQLVEYVASHSTQPDGDDWKFSVVESQCPGAEISHFASQRANPLLVIGCHGRNALSVALLGSDASQTLRTSQSAVLVVKRRNENLGFVRALLGMTS